MRFLVTGVRLGDKSDELPSSIRHLTPIHQFEAVNEEEARSEIARTYPGEAIDYLRLWSAVDLV